MHVQSLFDEAVLRNQLWDEFQHFASSAEAAALHARLKAWAAREKLKERESETAFIQRFFVETWGYVLQGAASERSDYNCRPQFRVASSGEGGSIGFADLALGHFGGTGPTLAQVLCEFKDIRSGLDSPQARKGNTRSPVQQCLDYLSSAWQTRGAAAAEPCWAIVTDMNEFRLYTRLPGHSGRCQRFVISGGGTATDPDLCADNDIAAFRRFLFWRLFQPDMLLTEHSPCQLAQLLLNQLTRAQDIEKSFYREYQAYRQFLYESICAANPDFPGTRGKLVRLTQRLLDRCIFILFCQDMGRVLRYPPELLRDILIEYSNSRFYNPSSLRPWGTLRELFRAMGEGGQFGEHEIGCFNGGLFAPDAELDSLQVPAKVFCAKGQATAILQYPQTLLYFAGAYNFGLSSASGQKTIGLTTLGRIFEQSITELEIMEADAEGRISLNRLTRRKTDGVYYTPEWITRYIVEQTLGQRMADIRAELGEDKLPPLTDDAIAAYRAFQKNRRKTAPVAGAHREFLKQYRERLNRLRIVDPACGSGAFLIQALDCLVAEYRRMVSEEQRLEGQAGLFDQDEVIRSILANNLYGVDINPESLEITKLALWLHTASPGKALCSLDDNFCCGNSLVGADFAEFYRARHETLFEQADENERERINAFDWQAAFPAVFRDGGFDCVVGNPPYVKLQHFRRYQPDVAEYLMTARRSDGRPLYESTRSGNFDLYLPFIEKGVELLKASGRMGFIAPNLWLVNEYGRALRNKVKRQRCLERWLDFKSFQVFEEAITYTALQFFRKAPQDSIACAFAPDGKIDKLDWVGGGAIAYDSLPENGAWNFVPAAERALMEKLRLSCKSLTECCKSIIVGIQTSADAIYHLSRLAPGHYRTRSGDEVLIEDALMRPLVSGVEAKRYQLPQTNTWLLFPYNHDASQPRLISAVEMAERFPKGWAYLRSHEKQLRRREGGRFDNEQWYRFGRHQNLDKQELPKLCVAETVPSLRVSYDASGAFYLNNVRVNGILPTDINYGWYLLGILNAPVCTFVFQRLAKPKIGGWFEANKQFIAPLPVPEATSEQQQQVADMAERLQELHSHRRDLIAAVEERLHSPQTLPLSPRLRPSWLWAEVLTPAAWKTHPGAPSELSGRALTAWARAAYDAALQARLAPLNARLQADARLEVLNSDDKIWLSVNGVEVLAVYDKPDTPFLAAQWRHALRDLSPSESFDGNRLLRLLLDLRSCREQSLRARIVALDRDIAKQEKDIAAAEQQLNATIYQLYDLTDDEIARIETSQ
jgi:hypothetical protein